MPGEGLFESYLDRRALLYRYQPQLGGSRKRPDYLLRVSSHDILCEITEFAQNEADYHAQLERPRRTRQYGRLLVTDAGWASVEVMTERVRANIEDECRRD